MQNPKSKSVTAATTDSRLVVGGKVDFTELAKEAAEIKERMIEVHKGITAIWNAQKCRELATVESCVRNVVDYLDKLPDAVKRFSSKTGGTSAAKGTSVLSKPR